MRSVEFILIVLFQNWDLFIGNTEVQLKYKICANRYSMKWRRDSEKAKSVMKCGILCSRINWCRGVTVCPDNTKGYECHFHFGIFGATCESFELYPECKMMLEIVKSTEPISPEGCENGGVWNGSACQCIDGFTSTYCERYLKDCREGKDLGLVNTPGPYNNMRALIWPTGARYPFEVLCNFREGKVIMLFRDKNVPLNWNRTWNEYKYKFGTEYAHWMGLEHIHALTNSAEYKLQIYFYMDSTPGQMFYTKFNIGPESSNYELSYDAATVESDRDGMINAIPNSNPLGLLDTSRPFCTFDIPGCTDAFEYGGWWHSPFATVYSFTTLNPPWMILHFGQNASMTSFSLQLIRIV